MNGIARTPPISIPPSLTRCKMCITPLNKVQALHFQILVIKSHLLHTKVFKSLKCRISHNRNCALVYMTQ